MKTYRNSESSSENFSGGKFGAVSIDIEAIANLAATALVASDVNATDATLVVTLNRMVDGEMQEFTIMDAMLAPLLNASAYSNAQVKFTSPSQTGNNMYLIKLAQGVATKEVGLKAVTIPFGGVIDTTEGGGIINVQLSVGDSFFSANTNTALSTITVDLKMMEGIEQYIPKVECKVIPANEVAPEYSATGIIKRLCLVNLDKTAITNANATLTQAVITTDAFSRTRTFDQLLEDRGSEFESTEAYSLRALTFDLLPWNFDKWYSKVKIRPSLVSVNINASQNWYVCWRGIPSESSMMMKARSEERAFTTARQVFGESAKKFKQLTQE